MKCPAPVLEQPVRERPILFSAPMVRAILDGRKTQTRRVLAPQSEHGATRCHYSPTGWAAASDRDGCTCRPIPARYGDIGDRLWVRETWAYYPDEHHVIYLAREGVELKESGVDLDGLWKPSIHMPRWASRLMLIVTDVRVERLQSISREDVRAEGVPETFGDWGAMRFPGYEAHLWDNMRFDEQWKLCWDQINGKRPGCSWDDDPWVWAISFRPLEGSDHLPC